MHMNIHCQVAHATACVLCRLYVRRDDSMLVRSTSTRYTVGAQSIAGTRQSTAQACILVAKFVAILSKTKQQKHTHTKKTRIGIRISRTNSCALMTSTSTQKQRHKAGPQCRQARWQAQDRPDCSRRRKWVVIAAHVHRLARPHSLFLTAW